MWLGIKNEPHFELSKSIAWGYTCKALIFVYYLVLKIYNKSKKAPFLNEHENTWKEVPVELEDFSWCLLNGKIFLNILTVMIWKTKFEKVRFY